MKNRSFIFTAVVASLLCVGCTKTQTTLSENERPFNPPIMGWSSWNAFLVAPLFKKEKRCKSLNFKEVRGFFISKNRQN
ncbi:hypothetical protein [Bacteroides finegoldii]|uniref:hypothetical protein n=1 Tax=Bacteroides finegoldii TaxID=338188 RepID=UPI00189DEE2C|nr:hypothetical protein [Bacteroides finegoldii]